MFNGLETKIDGRMKIRPPLFSGEYYSKYPSDLRKEINILLQKTKLPDFSYNKIKALVVPEEKHSICGRLLAIAYKALGLKRFVRRIYLVGKRNVGIEGFIFDGNNYWKTPLGHIEVVIPKTISNYIIDTRPHFDTPAIETQLPFLQTVIPRFSITPILTDKTVGTSDISSLISSVSSKESVFIFISNILSDPVSVETNNYYTLGGNNNNFLVASLYDLAKNNSWKPVCLDSENTFDSLKPTINNQRHTAIAFLG